MDPSIVTVDWVIETGPVVVALGILGLALTVGGRLSILVGSYLLGLGSGLTGIALDNGIVTSVRR